MLRLPKARSSGKSVLCGNLNLVIPDRMKRGNNDRSILIELHPKNEWHDQKHQGRFHASFLKVLDVERLYASVRLLWFQAVLQ